jgi:hypothetical protein
VFNFVAPMLVIWQVGQLLFADFVEIYFFTTDHGSIVLSVEIV